MPNTEYKNTHMHAEPTYLKLEIDELREKLESMIVLDPTKMKKGLCGVCGNPCHPDYQFHEYCMNTYDDIRRRIREHLKQQSKGVKAI